MAMALERQHGQILSHPQLEAEDFQFQVGLLQVRRLVPVILGGQKQRQNRARCRHT